jgi:osmotically-inducible protein OsmY
MNTIKNKILALFAVVMLSTAGVFATGVTVKDTKSLTKIERQVRSELAGLPRVGVFDNLAFKVEGETVTLYGQVVEPMSRRSAAKRIAKIEGVKNVVNNIEVLPTSAFDDRIREQTLVTFVNRGGSLYRYLQGTNPSLRIIVKNGNVTLEGIVSDKGDARLANILANGIFGVFSVTNNLQVENSKRL